MARRMRNTKAEDALMTRRERLMATLNGRPVDRPAVSFYEIGGFQINPSDPDPYNIYNAPGWLRCCSWQRNRPTSSA